MKGSSSWFSRIWQPLQWEKKDDFEKSIAGYLCKKAVTNIDGKKITAFYAIDLPALYGPGIASGLPGTILELWFEGDPRVMTAKSIERNISLSITRPSSGKLVTASKYRKAVEELVARRYSSASGFNDNPKGYGKNDIPAFGNKNHIGVSYVEPSPLSGASPAMPYNVFPGSHNYQQ